jgi:malate/lactate dehydrogenase
MFPDTTYVTVNQKNIHEHLDKNWREKEFIPRVQ